MYHPVGTCRMGGDDASVVPVTVRITYSGDDIVDYLSYISDADGRLSALLPQTAVTETGHIAVTDHRPDPAGDCGVLWSNTVIVTATTGT
jgi:hypothetical protein